MQAQMEAQSADNPDSVAFLRVTIGSPIVTSDAEWIGVVKKLRPDAFQVRTGLFHRDYWLPREIVAEAVPDEMVILSVDKAHVASCKLRRLVGGPDQVA